MKDANQRWAEEVVDSMHMLKTLKDELKVQLHLASMEASARFTALEQRLDGEQLTVRKNLNELIASFRVLKDDLGKAGRPIGKD